MTPPGERRAHGHQTATPGAPCRARPQTAAPGVLGCARPPRAGRAAGARAWVVPLLLSWLWLVACSAPAPATSGPAAPAAPAAPAKPADAPPAAAAVAPAPTAPSARPTLAPLNPPVQVKVGLTGIAPEAALYQAVERGYFADEGLEVELVPVRGITEQVGLLATGQLHLGNGGVDPGLFNAAQREIGLKLVTTLVSSTEKNPGAAALIVRQDLVDSGQYQSLRDLKGLTIAVSAIGTTSQMHIEKALAQGGLTVDDVNIVAMSFPDMLTALGNKAVDAAWQVEPFIAIANTRGIAKTMAQAGEVYPGALGVVMAISPRFAADQPEAARRYLTAYLRGVRDYYRAFVSDENPAGREEFYQVLMKHTAVKDAALYPLMGWSGVDPNGGLDEGKLAEMQDYLFQRGTVREKLDVSRVVDHSYANYAVERLGRYPQ